MKLLVPEPGSSEAETLWSAADTMFTGRLTYVEARAALVRARRDRRLAPNAFAASKRGLESRYASLDVVEVREPVVRLAGELAEHHRLHAYDAMHLASALALGDPELVVASWDDRLRAAARAQGLSTAPGHG